jgi:FkbM family methyltransferase
MVRRFATTLCPSRRILMKIGGRNLRTITRAPLETRHYIAVWNLLRGTPEPLQVLARYLSGRGNYPARFSVRTPSGSIAPQLYSHHDLLTINEIFFRLDYEAPDDLRVVVDLGSNIGISALYFLTRNSFARCHLFEPVPRNIERLKANLVGYESRYELNECAVGPESGEFEFGLEPTGRYGGLGVAHSSSIRVRCRSINEVLGEILEREGFVDVLKIDTEGAEAATLEAIEAKHLKRIGRILAETENASSHIAEHFHISRYGPIVRYVNKDVGFRQARS